VETDEGVDREVLFFAVYADFSTNEPILDGTVSLMLLRKVWDDPAGGRFTNPSILSWR
jgi:hypothetical protein